MQNLTLNTNLLILSSIILQNESKLFSMPKKWTNSLKTNSEKEYFALASRKKKDGESRDHNTHSRVMWNGLVCSTSGHPEVKKSTTSQRAYIITRNVRTAGGMHSTQN